MFRFRYSHASRAQQHSGTRLATKSYSYSATMYLVSDQPPFKPIWETSRGVYLKCDRREMQDTRADTFFVASEYIRTLPTTLIALSAHVRGMIFTCFVAHTNAFPTRLDLTTLPAHVALTVVRTSTVSYTRSWVPTWTEKKNATNTAVPTFPLRTFVVSTLLRAVATGTSGVRRCTITPPAAAAKRDCYVPTPCGRGHFPVGTDPSRCIQ